MFLHFIRHPTFHRSPLILACRTEDDDEDEFQIVLDTDNLEKNTYLILVVREVQRGKRRVGEHTKKRSESERRRGERETEINSYDE